MILIFRFIIALILLQPVVSYALSEDEQSRIIQEFAFSIEPRFTKMQGGAIAILSKGKVVYQKTFGYRKGKTDPITPHTLFALASTSKAVTGTALALMAERGKIDLEARHKLPYIKTEVSLTDILSHTTGYSFYGNSDIERGASRHELLSRLQKQKPSCEPGSCYFYTNMVFTLTEEVLKKENNSYAKALAELRGALGTEEIQIMPIEKSMQVAIPHTKTKDGFKSLGMPPYYPKAVASAAGIFASLDGMVEIYKLLFGYRPDLISRPVLDKIYACKLTNSDTQKFRPPYPLSDIESYYGLGMRT